MSRRRSEGAQRNDERLLDAATAELVEVGIDHLAMSAVARRAGLTTGALYSRYENVTELAAAVWTSRVRDRHHALLDIAVRSLIERDRGADIDHLLAELLQPSEDTLLAIELLATARRVDDLEEVVFRDVAEWMRGWRAGPRGNRQRRAQVAYTLGMVWGVLLHEVPSKARREWTYTTRSLRSSFGRAYAEPTTPFVPDVTHAIAADTGDAAQNALIDSVAMSVGRVGFERSSATRIARRAGVTPGSIYSRYRTKDDLLRHAVETLLARRFRDDLAANRDTFVGKEVGTTTAQIVGGYLSAERREWRLLRIEAQIAAIHRPDLSDALDRIQQEAIREYLDVLGAGNDEERAALDEIAASAQALPLGLAFLDLVTEGVSAIDWRRVLVPLLTPGA
ncbi:MAG TPA: TetR family transcriptional regulator [Acidimicrobiia bacterium]|nr:TetR family transcriptional regulator [Acidimicrobiia bacterium]